MRCHYTNRWLTLLAAGLALATVAADKPPAITYNIRADGYYAREATDGDWFLHLTGRIPSLCGVYLMVLDTAGRAIYRGVIPHGEYPPDKPFRVKVPADGIAGDYLLKLVGHQDDFLGLAVPFTQLPFEVYGKRSFAIAHELAEVPVWFQVPPGQTGLTLGAYKGHLQVLDATGKTVADTRLTGHYEDGDSKTGFRYSNVMDVALQPNTPYQLRRECFYFSSKQPLYLCFDPARWFAPDPRLDDIKWWEVVK